MAKKKRRRTYKRRKLNKLKLKKGTVYTIVSVGLFVLSGILVVSLVHPSSLLLQSIAQVVIKWFGKMAWLIPIILASLGFLFLRIKFFFAKPNIFLGLVMLFISISGMGQTGMFGNTLWINTSYILSDPGAWIVFIGLLIIGFAVLLNTSLDEIFIFIISIVQDMYTILSRITKRKPVLPEGLSDKKLLINTGPLRNEKTHIVKNSDEISDKKEAGKISETVLPGLQSSTVINTKDQQYKWEYPPLSILSDPEEKPETSEDSKRNAHEIENTLNSFGIKAKVVEANIGPAVTQYALEVARGTKLSKITSLSHNLAYALAAPTGQIRIEAPIPGRSLVGVEVPNRSLTIVKLKEMLLTKALQEHPSKLAIGLGLNSSKNPVIMDLATLPHVLIAGTTGSGKSVLINSIIANILYRTTPAEVRLILVDPKRVELSIYNDIPHLLTPVIVEPKQTLSALQWAMKEMDKRYKRFAEVGSRNIESYNKAKGYQEIPYIVIIVDELADLMIFAAAEVEDAITRLAQMARATGIHLVISTQRPSVNVITGLIKANIPARISFNVSSMIDSRVILDMPGAEKLLGRGDMLFIPPTQSKPIRIQGTFISEQEVRKLVDFLKKKVQSKEIPVEYTEEITQQEVAIKKPTGLVETTEGRDVKFLEAKRIVTEYDRASASFLQRKLKVGYSRAARILDQLEEAGIVGPAEGAKPREVIKRIQDN